MARRPNMIKTKVKPIRTSRSEQYLVNFKYLGDEPDVFDTSNGSKVAEALTWYNYMSTNIEGKSWLIEWLQSNKRDADAKIIKRVNESSMSSTMYWMARMQLRGVVFPENSVAFFESKIKEALAKKVEAVVEKVETNTNVVSIQDRIRDKASEIIGDIEEIIDREVITSNSLKFSLYEYLQKRQIPAMYVAKIIDHYTPWLAELCEAHGTNDPQLKEAYGHYTKKQHEARIVFFNTLIEDANRYGSNTKKARAPRKPRPVSVDKQLKGLKYQKESSEFKVTSVKPEKIVGCQELWTFNTKYKLITVLRAADRGGLQIKGTSITGYDEKTSVTKRAGRKPEYFVDKILNGGKMVLRKLMDEAKGDAPLAYRINENTVLMKIVA